MEFIFELIFELLIEGGIEISSNKKINKIIRYPILIILILLFGTIIGGILCLGIFLFKRSLLASLMLIGIALSILIASILKFRRIYMGNKKKTK